MGGRGSAIPQQQCSRHFVKLRLILCATVFKRAVNDALDKPSDCVIEAKMRVSICNIECQNRATCLPACLPVCQIVHHSLLLNYTYQYTQSIQTIILHIFKIAFLRVVCAGLAKMYVNSINEDV